jgi:hypothetical protein
MRGTAVAVLVCAVRLIAAPSATADSLVFIRDSNVWLANLDGSGQYQFTGTPVLGASRASLLASGKHTFAAAGTARVAMKLTRKGARALRRAKGVSGSLRATFTPPGGAPTTATKTLRLRR